MSDSSLTENVQWYQLDVDTAASRLEVDPKSGLSEAVVKARQAQYGANKLAEKALQNNQ